MHPPFAFAEEGAEFETRFGQELIRIFRQTLLRGMPEENLQLYTHGSKWTHATDAGPAMESTFSARSVEGAMRITDIMDGEIAALSRYLAEMEESFAKMQLRDLESTVETATAQVGNVVSAVGKTAPELFLALLKKVEFGVGPDGKVTRPILWGGGPGFKEKVEDRLANDQEFKAEVERLEAQKTADALDREARRKSRFKKPE